MANNYRTLPRGLGKAEIESSRADAELRRCLREGTPLPAGTYELSMDEYNALFPLPKEAPFVQTVGRGTVSGRFSGGKQIATVPKSMFSVANAKAMQEMRSQMLEADLILWDEAHVFDSPLKQVVRMTYNDFYAPRISKHVGEMHPDLMTADNWRAITVAEAYALASNYWTSCDIVDILATKAWVTYMDDVQLWRWHDESAPFVDYGYVRGMLMAQHYGQMNYSYLRLTLLRYNDFTRGVEGATTWKR